AAAPQRGEVLPDHLAHRHTVQPPAHLLSHLPAVGTARSGRLRLVRGTGSALAAPAAFDRDVLPWRNRVVPLRPDLRADRQPPLQGTGAFLAVMPAGSRA